MQIKRSILAVAVAATTVPLTAATRQDVEVYNIDTSHSHIGFAVRHLAVTNVKGRFTRFSGQILLNEDDVTKSSVNVTIDSNSIDTSNDRRDSDLRGADFFDVPSFPQITFVSKRIERSADGLVLVGDLTMRDVTKEVRIPFELVGPVVGASGQKRLGAEGTLKINRHDFGLKWNRVQEAVPVVGDEVKLELNVEAVTPRQRGTGAGR